MQITGNDVIGRPGQQLTHDELKILVGLADGDTPTQIGQVVGLDATSLRHAERTIQRKLGAKTKTHTITRGFVTGVLITRALCLLLVVTLSADLDVEPARAGRLRTTRIIRIRTRSELC